MVRIGTVWDRTTEVMAGRFGMLAAIAALTIVLPSALRDGWAAYSAPLPPGPVGLVLTLLWVLLLIYGTLALTAAASDPAHGRADALRLAGARFGAGLGVVVAIVAAAMLLTIPLGLLFAASGIDMQAARAGLAQPGAVSAGPLAIAGLYALVVGIAALFVFARLCLVYPLVVNERRGLGVFGASWRMTRGLTWKLVGVYILYAIVAGVATLAATFIVGAVFGLLLGRDNAALAVWLASVAGAVVTAGLTIVQTTFFAQLYLALRDPAEPFAAA